MIEPDPSDGPDADPGVVGFDVRPARPLLLTVTLFAVVVVVASVFAHGFRELSSRVIEEYADATGPTAAAASLGRLVVFVVVTSAVVVAATLGRVVERSWSNRVGVEAVAASARGEGRTISLRASWVRAVATWVASIGMVSIGRESAIIESGGAVGAVVGRRFGGRGDAMAAAGVAAAFAAAYHAPIAAVLYVEETLRVRRSRRAVTFACLGAAGGFAVSVVVLDSHTIFPGTQGPRWTMLWLAMVGMVPAVVVAHGFLQLRTRVSGGRLLRRFGRNRWLGVVALAIVAGLAVAGFPSAAGNGMEALRQASVEATLGTALALFAGKIVGTTAALGAGAPGGVLTPTISVTAGAALLTLLAADVLGLTVVSPWDAMVASMAVGVAVGLRSPLVAIVLVPELVGDYTLLPVTAAVVAVALLVDRVVIGLIERFGQRVPDRVYDEDA
ncbi:MAG: chloride channel protein [Ilumatobacteraceae bacterium]